MNALRYETNWSRKQYLERLSAEAADRAGTGAPPPAFVPHAAAPFPGHPFRIGRRDGAALSSDAACPGASGSTGAEAIAPATSAPATASSPVHFTPEGDEAVHLSEASRFILFLVAKFEGASESDVLARLITERGDAIGLSPLLGRHFEDSS